MESITVQEQSPNQCEILVGAYRVGYVCYGNERPINWLPKVCSGLTLTKEETAIVAKEVRRQMAEKMTQRQAIETEIAAISDPNYVYPGGDSGANEGTDSVGTDATC